MRDSLPFLRSLRTRIALAVLGVSLVTALSILLYVEKESVRAMTAAQEENARNLVHTVALSVESQYQSILFHKRVSMEKRKAMLRSVLDVAMVSVETAYEKAKRGEISERDAKRQAIAALKRMRYDNGVGYLWVNTTDLPIPRMVMHTTMPELDGHLLDEPRFDCALGRNENLFRAMVDVCLREGRGYVDYLWPKPTADGLTDRQPKLSYVELFKPWGWVVGTGLYIDDIDRDAKERLDAVLREFRRSFARMKVAETGYMFLFNGNQEMLVHPYLEGADFRKMPNPATGNPMLEDLIRVAHGPEQRLSYIWEKPPEFSGKFVFRKLAFVQYFEPLDWYIAASVYLDEIEAPARQVRFRVILLGGLLLILGLFVSLWLSRSLTRPLFHLTRAAKAIDEDVGSRNRVPVSGTIETRELGAVLNGMLGSLQDEIAERRQAEATLKKALQEKEVLLREVHHRVKNNMAVVVSLLSMQAKRVDDTQVRAALEESRGRVEAMSLIHETLHHSDSLAEIPLQEYVNRLHRAMQQAMVQVPGGVAFEVAGDPVNLTIEQAVPCGLVLNELITNSLKYAYPEGGPGTIRVEAKMTEEGWLQLDYRDDGVGLSTDFDPSHTQTLGMRIVKLIVENQLGGRLEWNRGQGAHFIFSWPVSGAEEKE